jgi:ABC-type Mn2+/Zn2+ transport system ATPase subunit
MEQFKEEGKTIVSVSHDLDTGEGIMPADNVTK